MELRLLLENVVERLNFSIDQLKIAFENQKEIFEIIGGVVNTQTKLIQSEKDLSRLSEQTTNTILEQAKVIEAIKK